MRRSGKALQVRQTVDTSYHEDAFASARIEPNFLASASVFVSWTVTLSSILTCPTPQCTQCKLSKPGASAREGSTLCELPRPCVCVHGEWPILLGSKPRRDCPPCSRPRALPIPFLARWTLFYRVLVRLGRGACGGMGRSRACISRRPRTAENPSLILADG